MKKTKNSKVLNNVKVSDADIKKYAKKLSVVSKGKAIGSIITGVALVGAGVGTATYFAVNKTAAVEGAGTIIVDPSIEAKDAIISSLETDTSGNKVSTVTSETRIITDVVVSVGSKTLVNGIDYSVTPRNEAKSDLKVTIYKETYEKYSSQGAFRITPQFAEKCLIIFDTDGGSDVQPISVEAGQKATKPNNPTKEGYEFLGWWCTNDQGQYVEFDFEDTPINKNLILHAKWDVPVTTKGIGYYYSDGGYYAYCSDYDELPSRIRIPSSYTDPDTGIKADVKGIYCDEEDIWGFWGCSNLEEVILPETFESIGYCAFQNCFQLKKINIPSKVTYIGRYAFYNCKNLESVNFPEGLKSIYVGAFEFTGLKEVILPDSLELIESGYFSRAPSKTGAISYEVWGAFAYNDNLYHVSFGNKIKTIPTASFSCCKNLMQVDIPISVTTIEVNAFNKANVEETYVIYPTFNFKDNFSYWVYYDTTSMVENISYCLTISGQSISKKGFKDSTGCYEIEFLEFYDDKNVFCSIKYCGKLKGGNLTIPETLKMTGYDDYTFIPIRISANFDDNGVVHNLTLNENIKSIAPEAFYKNDVIEAINFNENKEINIESIGERAFLSSSLSMFNSTVKGEVNLPSSLIYIGPGAFIYNDNLSSVKINSDIEMEIEGNYYSNEDDYSEYYFDYPFYGTEIKSYSVNEGNKCYVADSNTGALYSILNDKKTLIAYPSFDSENEDENIIEIMESTTNITDLSLSAHNACYYVNKIKIPSTLESFGNAFSCFYSFNEEAFDSLKSFELAEDSAYFKTSDDKATLFNYDKTLLVKFAIASNEEESFTYVLEDSVTEIGTYAFNRAKNLKSINLGNVKNIGESAFINCSSLSEISLDSIISVGYSAFRCDEGLTKISIGENCTSLGGEVFTDVPSDTCMMYIDSSIIANLTTDDIGSDSSSFLRIFKENVYIKDTISLNDSSLIKQKYKESETQTVEGYILYTYSD